MHCPQHASCLHFGLLARHHPSTTLPLHWVKGITTAIALVTVLPEGGIHYFQVYLVWSSENAMAMALIAPPPHRYKGRAIPWSQWACLYARQESSSSSAFCLQKLQLNDAIVLNACVSLLGCPSAIIQLYQTSM
jgi:hypothetical protein